MGKVINMIKSAVAAALILAACPLPAAAQQAPVEPGPNAVDPLDAAVLFQQVCTASAPDFTGVPKVLSALPFQQHPETGTFYHRDLDLSFKVQDRDGEMQCSMVFGTEMLDSSDTLALTLAGSGAPMETIVTDPQTHDGRIYVAVFGIGQP